MSNDDVKLPSEMTAEIETARIIEGKDKTDTEVAIDKSTQESYTEAATIEVGITNVSKNIKFYNGKFEISSQSKKWIDELISDLKDCNDVDALNEVFESFKFPEEKYVDMILPYILTQVLVNEKKFPGKEPAIANMLEKEVYAKKKADKGSSRFSDYDLYSTFKSDKEGTIHFLEDFFYGNLVTNDKASISNNVLLALFNIFDSRVYLNQMYAAIGKNDEYDSPVDFVKKIRARINKNSRATNVYQPDASPSEKKEATPEDVQEFAREQIRSFGDIELKDILYCEQIAHIVYDEISTISDRIYNEGYSIIGVNNYLKGGFFTEVEKGHIPDYMKTRIGLSDDEEGSKKKDDDGPKTTNIPDPYIEPPANSVDDLADSVDTKADREGPIEDSIGSNYQPPKGNDSGKIVYNITNNTTYTNSFNSQVDSHNTSNDLSTGKSTTSTNKSEGSHNTSTSVKADATVAEKKPKNNYNNRIESLDSKGSKPASVSEFCLSNGMTVTDMLAYLESEEPLSNDEHSVTKGAKSDSLSDAMARSRQRRQDKKDAKRQANATDEKGSKSKPKYLVGQKLKGFVDSLIKRDEDKVKAEIIENPSYRSSLYKAGRLAIKLGLTGLFFTISGWFGVAYLGIQGMKYADKQRLRTEVQDECLTEIRIIDEKIEYLRSNSRYGERDNPENRKKIYELMRMRNKLEGIVAESSKGRERMRAVDRNRPRGGSSRSYW